MKKKISILNLFSIKLNRTFTLSLISFFIYLTSATAQIEVHAVLDSSSIRIGAQTKLDIYLNYDASTQKNLEIVWPIIEDTLKKGLEVINITKIDTTIPDKNKPNLIQQHIQLTVTSFDEGDYYISMSAGKGESPWPGNENPL